MNIIKYFGCPLVRWGPGGAFISFVWNLPGFLSSSVHHQASRPSTKSNIGQKRESLASHPSLDILIFTPGRSKPGQKKLFFRRPRRRQTKIRLLHFGILRQRAVDPGQRKPGRQPQARPAWKGCVSTDPCPHHIQSSNTYFFYFMFKSSWFFLC